MNPSIKQLRKIIQALDCRGLVWLFYAACLAGWFGYLKIKNRSNRSYMFNRSYWASKFYMANRSDGSNMIDLTNRSDGSDGTNRIYKSDRADMINRSDRTKSNLIYKSNRSYMTYESYKTYKYSLQALALVRNKTHNTYHITDNRQKAVMKVRARIAGFAVDLEGVNVGKFLEAKLNIVLFKESLIEAGLIISRFSRNRYRYYLRKTKKVYIPAGIVFGKSVLKVVALLAVVFGYVMMFVGKTLVEFALASFMFLSLRARSAWRSALEQLIRLFRRSKVEALKLLAKTYALSIRLRVELVRQERLLANRLRERSKIAWRSVQKNVIRMYKHLKYMLTVLYVIVEERVSKTAVFTSTKAGALKLLAMTGKESTLIIAKETKELVVLEGMNLFIGLVSFMENVREQGVDTALTVKEISSEQSIKFYANLISLVQILHLYSRIAINRLLLRLWRIAKMRVLSIRLLASLASGLRRSKIEAFKLLAKTVISLRLLRPQGRTGSLRQQLVAELAYLAGRRVEAFDYALLLAKTGRLIEKNTKSTYIHLKYLLTVLYVIIEKMVSKTAVFTSTKAGAAYTYMRPKLARFSKSVFARLEVGAELLVQFALLFIDYSQKLLSFLIRLGRIGLAWTANYLAPVVDVVEIMVFEPAWEFIQKRSVFIRKAVAITSLSFLIVGSISPVLAVEIIPQSIVEFTDASIDPLNPVLQQEASVSGNEGSNLVADVRKKVEELTRPDNSEEGVELSDDGDSGSFQPSSANDNIMPEQLNEADSEAAEDNTAEEQTQNLDPCVVSNSMELDSEAPPGEATGSGEAIEENGSEDGSSEETDQPAGNDQINQDQAIESGEADEEENDLVSESAGDEGSDQGAVEGVEDDPGSEEAQAGSAGNEGSDDQGIEDVDPDIHQDCGVMGQDDAGAQDINTGDSSLLDTQEIKKNIVEIVNTNNIKVTNEVDSDSLTGKNIVSAGDSGRDVFLGSGAINIHANVLNVVNTNLYNSKIVEIAESFNNLTADVLLNHPETRPAELTQDLVNYVCSSTLTCDSLSSFNLTNKNNAEVENNVDVFGNSGQNLLENIKERGTIRSGNVNALVNILNIVNSNLVNSRWTIASINVFGDWEGDLVLPSELYFTDFFQLGATDNSDIKVEDIKKVLININNDNDVEVQNNVIVDSDSGKNSIEATKSAGGKGGGLTDDEMGTGESRGESNVKNYLNTNVLNGKWYLGMVNTLGAWSGDVYSLPDRVALGTTPTGLSFFSSNSKDSDLAYQMFEETMAEINKEDTTLIDIQNQNKAKIVNNVDLGVLSGENGIKGNEMNVKESGIFSGNTYALANILNFANTNLVNADLNIGLVNVFGRWNGNVLFGFPDLTVSQTTRQEFPKEKDKTVIYDVSYSNMGSSSMMGGSLEWHYDNELLRLDSVDPVVNYEEKSPGAVEFDLGRVSPNARGKFAIKLTTLKNLEVNSEIESYAHIFGIGPERVKENNESVYTAIAVTTASSSGPAPPPSNNPPPSQDPPGTQNPPDTQEPPNDDDEDAAGEPEPDETQNDDPVEGDPNDTNENPNDPNNNEPQENQPQNNPSNNNQGQQQQQNQRTSTGLIRVYKTNNALSSGVKPGEPVEFTLTVDNDGIDDVFNVVLYDTLRGPDGVALTTRKFPLGRMEAGEEVVLVYEIDANPFAPAGTYTNTAYVEALNFQLQAITSQFSAISSFKLVNPNPKPLPDDEVVELIKDNDQGEEQQEKLNEEEEDTAQGQEGETDEAIEQDENEKVGLNSNQNKNTPINTNTVKGTRFSRTNPQANFAGGGALGELTPAAKAELIDIIPLLENSSHDGVQSDSTRQMIMFIIIASLMGFGYATANLVNRLKKAKVQKLTNNNMPGKDKILFLVFAMILGNSGMGAIMDINLNIPVAQAAAQSCTTPTVISFPFAVQGNAGGVDLNANAKVTGNVYSNANINGQYWAKVIGNASAIGTITQTQVTGVTTTGAAAAGMPTVNVADWKASALLGGTIGGVSFPVNSSGNNLGPVKINGDLILNDNSDVQVNGTVHVTGNVIIGKNAELHVNPALGALGTVVIVDGKIDIDGNGHVDGTGGGGFMLLISLSSGSDAINLQPNFASSTAVFYSMNDGLMVGSNSEIVGAYGEKVVVDDNAKVNHVPGLQVATFVCPPPALVPDISVTKSADSSSVTAGDTVTFTIEVENSGTASATGVLVSDVLDSEFEFVSSTPSPTTTLITGLGTELTYSLGTVGIGQTKIITIEAKTDAGVVSTTLVENKATASGSNFSDENSNTVEVTINPSVAPAIVVTKSSDESLVSVGDSVVFTLEVENTGTADATNVVLSDTLALEFEFVSSTPVPTTNTVTALGTELTFDIGTVAVGTTSTITIEAKIDSSIVSTTIVENKATVSGDNFSDEDSNIVEVTISTAPVPIISVTKSVDSSSVIAGDTVIFTLEVENTGTADATNVVLSDTLALEFEFVSSTPVPTTNTVTALGTELTFDIGTVAVGDTATITIEVKTDSSVTPATLIENKAQADGDNFGVSDSNTVEVTINPTSGGGGGPTDPTITKDTSDINPTAGQVITYTIEVENSSSSTIVDVIITDVLDENLEFVSADTAPTTNTTVLDITTLTWEIGDLLVGETFLIELRVEVKNATNPGTVIKNDAELSALGFGPVIASAPDVEVISTGGGGGSSGGGGGGAVPVPTPNYQADLDFQFADPKTKGEDYGESVTIINTGSIALSPGDLVLTFPASLDVVTANPSANSIVGNVFTWSIPVIPVAGTYRVEFTVKPNTPGPSIITVANFYIGNQQIAVSSVSESVGDVKGAKTPEDLPRTGAGVAYLLLFNLPLLLLRRLKRASAAVLLLIAGFFVLNFNYFKEVIGFSLNEKSGQQEQLLSEEILAPNTLTVPSLGIVVPIIIDSGKSEEEFQAALRNGVVHYPGTSQVGRFGNSYIFGHSSDYLWSEGNYKTVFAVLPKINIGAEIVATDTEGQEYAYYVKETKVVGPSDLSVLEQDYSKKVLTLQTSYPIGTALRRFIVISELKEE